MKKLVAALAALGMMPGAAHAADGEPLVFKPSSQWAADFGEDYCRLARTFSDGTNEISLGIERIQPTTLSRLILIGDGIRLYRRADTIGYRYLASGDDRTTQLLRTDTGDGQQYLIMGSVNIGPDLATLFAGPTAGQAAGSPPAGPPAPGAPLYNAGFEASFADGITGIALTDGTVEPIRIETGSLKNVITVLQDCTYDLLTYWGLDGAKHRALSRTAYIDPAWKLPNGIVPFTDFAKLGGNSNQVRVMISAEGKPTSCHIHIPTLSEGVNGKICKMLMEEATYHPALDAGGQPIASFVTSELFFLFPPFGGT
jgi:hypothetical protein